MKPDSPTRIAVDIGGTFTDGILLDDASGEVRVAKSLTTPGDPGEGHSGLLPARELAYLARRKVQHADPVKRVRRDRPVLLPDAAKQAQPAVKFWRGSAPT